MASGAIVPASSEVSISDPACATIADPAVTALNPPATALDDEIRRWSRAARARLRIAQQLDPEREFPAALALYREGLIALIAAAVASTQRRPSADDLSGIGAAWHALEAVWNDLAIKVDLAEFETVRTVLCAAPPFFAPHRAPAEAITTSDALVRFVATLERAVRIRQRSGPSRRRGLRIVGLVLVVAALVPVALWIASPKNLALHRPVTMSSSLPAAYTPKDGSGLVNGKVEYTYGAHTDVQDGPWIQLDLQQPVRIRKIVVHNRGDGWFDDAVPLFVDIGADEKSMHPLDHRNKLFTRTDPWIIDRIDETVRYIRLYKKGHSYIALTEVFVYDR
jgi:hypothetical protein